MTATQTKTHELFTDAAGTVPVTVTERGQGRAILVLHGGAGPQSVAEFAALLAEAEHARVITPTHPGFGGTPRPDRLASVGGLAALYLALLEELDVTDVTVVGNSVGGWVAAELALFGSARVARLVLLDATGVEVDGHPVADVSGKTLPQILGLGFHNSGPFLLDPSSLPAAVQQIAAGNRAALAAYAGPGADPTLLSRVADSKLATLVVWGESDRIVDPDYGRAFAAAIPGATFCLLQGTGHTPQVETPEQVVAVISTFLTATAAWAHDYTENTTVAPEHVWATLEDLYTGTRLTDHDDEVVIHGPFAVGTPMSVTPAGADFVVACTITELLECQVFTYRSEFNGLHITNRFDLARLPLGGTRINQHSTIAGPEAEKKGPVIGPRITEDHPDAMRDLLAAAAKRTGAAVGQASSSLT